MAPMQALTVRSAPLNVTREAVLMSRSAARPTCVRAHAEALLHGGQHGADAGPLGRLRVAVPPHQRAEGDVVGLQEVACRGRMQGQIALKMLLWTPQPLPCRDCSQKCTASYRKRA